MLQYIIMSLLYLDIRQADAVIALYIICYITRALLRLNYTGHGTQQGVSSYSLSYIYSVHKQFINFNQ